MKRKVKIAYVLRTCAADMTSHNGRFRWPESGPVALPDWDPKPECGNGLHGFLRGEGDGRLASFAPDAKWLVVKVRLADVIDLAGKVKFPRGVVVFCGDRAGATALIKKKHPRATIVGGTSTSGDCGTSTSGDYGTSTSGFRGTSTSGYGGTSTSGDYGTSTSGFRGTSTSGFRGTSTSGDCGTSMAGENGILVIRFWDGRRDRLVVGYVGEGGIKAGVKYRLNAEHQLVEVPS